jgi:hypothetical protein
MDGEEEENGKTYQGDDLHEAPEGEDDSEKHGCNFEGDVEVMLFSVLCSMQYAVLTAT